MKSLPTLPAAAILLASCSAPTPPPNPFGFYSERTAYHLGFRHGSGDRSLGLTHSPHINDPDEVPSAHRNAYIWGYTEGYGDPGRDVGDYPPSYSK